MKRLEEGPLRCAVVGLGIGMAHVAGYLADEHATLVAIADRWEPRRRSIGGTFSQGSMGVLRPLFRDLEDDPGLDHPWSELGIASYEDIAAVAADPTIELVSLCTPDDLHEQHALLLLEAGKHLLLEKPPALAMDGVRRIEKAAKRAGRRVAIGYEFRLNPAVVRLRELVAEGSLGEIRAMTIYHYRDSFRRDKWENWIQSRERSGGLIVEETCHWFDLLRWIPGKEVAELSCGAVGGINTDFDFEDLAMIQGRYEDGAIFQISHALTGHDFSLILTVHGTLGTAWCALKEQSWSSLDGGATDYLGILSWAPIGARPADARVERWGQEATEPFVIREHSRAVVAAIREDTSFPAELVDGERSLAIALAARRSSIEGKAITL